MENSHFLQAVCRLTTPRDRSQTALNYFIHRVLKEPYMTGEILNAALLSASLILVGLGMGFVLLKIQGGAE